jgi:hypothetical protein
MSDGPARRTRLSKGRVRAVAWVAGGATFLTGVGILGVSPKPDPSTAAASPPRAKRPVVIVRKVLRRVIVTDPVASAPVRVIPGTSTSTAGSGGGDTSSAAAPAPAPVTTSTGGS